MTIEELNKLIKEELDAYLDEADEEGDDIEITTDEPSAKTGDEALEILRQIYDLIKPEIEGGEGEPEMEEPEMDMPDIEEPEGDEKEDKKDKKDKDDDKEEVDENLDRPNYKASDVQDVTFNAEKLKGGLNESVDMKARFKKLANIK